MQGGLYAIHWAAWKGHVEAVKLLVSWGGVQMLSKKDDAVCSAVHHSPVTCASCIHHICVLRVMQGRTPLDLAQTDEMRKLLNSYK